MTLAGKTRTLTVVVIVGAIAAACTSAETQPSTTKPEPPPLTTATTQATTTTASPDGPQPLREFAFLEPGDYVTTEYQPALEITLDRKYVMQFLERPSVLSFTNRRRSRTPRPPNREETDLGLSVPHYAVEAFEARPDVIVRVGGTELPGVVAYGFVTADVASLGLGVGDPVDVTLRADL